MGLVRKREDANNRDKLHPARAVYFYPTGPKPLDILSTFASTW